jgi:chaperonin cofactor prefoldin
MHALQELNLLDEEAAVFKLIGPALIRQDLVEAKSNVSKRMEYIKSEMDRTDGQIKGLEGKLRDKEGEVRALALLQPTSWPVLEVQADDEQYLSIWNAPAG